MAKPNSRAELIEYCLRQLGYPVLEINVEDDQLNDRLDDALQYFQERHFDGIERCYLKHKITAEESQLIRTVPTFSTGSSATGITTSVMEEAQNFIPLPDNIIGVNMVFKTDANTMGSSLFNIQYQIFLNDLYNYGSLDLLNYAMTKTYLEDISRIITPDTQLRFNKKNHRLYLDIDWKMARDNSYLIIDCYRIISPESFNDVYNDYWIKRYLTATIKKQWGQNLIKFNGVQLPGGISFNGRQIFDDAVREIQELEKQLKDEYELPPLGLIG